MTPQQQYVSNDNVTHGITS